MSLFAASVNRHRHVDFSKLVTVYTSREADPESPVLQTHEYLLLMYFQDQAPAQLLSGFTAFLLAYL